MIDPSKLTQLEQEYGLPQGLLNAVMMKESGGNPNAVSPAGAQGLFQFMPATAKAYGVSPFDPESSAVGAARMYGDLSKQYKGDIDSMLAAYNWGSGNLAKKGMENAPPETRDYISSIKKALPQYADSGQVMTDAAVDAVEPGNIDLAARPVVKNQDGTISTVRSMSFQDDSGVEVLIPTVSDDGKILSQQDAIKQYLATGKHLGKFLTPKSATSYAKALHNQQADMYGDTMDVEMPDGTIITDVPAGTTQAQLLQMLEGKPQAEPVKRAETSGLAAFADGTLQGATLNLADEAEAGLRTGARSASRFLEKLIYGDNVLPETTYEDELGGVRNRIAQETADSPYASMAGNVTGGVAGLLTGGGALGQFAPKAATALRSFGAAAPLKAAATTGAVSGALYGFGGGEGSAEERGAEAIRGGITGAIAGPAAALVAKHVVAPIASKVTSGLSKTAKKFNVPTTTPKTTGTVAQTQAMTPDLIKPNGEAFSKTAGQRTQAPDLQRLENDARAGLLTADAESAIRNADVTQNREFIGFVNKLAGGLDEGRDINSLVDSIGSTIQSNAKAAGKAVNNAYDLAKEGKGVKIGIEDIRKGLWRGIVDTKKEGAYDLTQMPKASAVLTRLADYSKKRGLTKVTSVKLGEMENWRKQVTNAIASTQDPTEKRFLGQMINNYDGFMEKTAAEAVDLGDAQAINAFKAAVKSRREYGQLFEKNKLVESIVGGQKSVDDTVKELIGAGSIKGKKEMANNLNAILKASGEQAEVVQADLKQAFMKKVFDKATLGTEPNNPNMARLSPAKLKTELENIFVHQSDFAKSLYGEDAVKAAQQAIKELELISTTQSNVKNVSGSGELVGRFLKIMGKVPVAGKPVAGIANTALESGKKYKGSQEVLKGLDEFYQTLTPSPKSGLWATIPPVAVNAASEGGEQERQPLKLTIPRPN